MKLIGSCYNVFTHSCDGRCQGCSFCPFAEAYHSSFFNNNIPKVTRWQMFKYCILTSYDNWKWNRWMRKHKDEIDKAIYDIINQHEMD